MNIKERILPVLTAILKGWAVGASIGITLGGAAGVVLAKLYGDHSTISNIWVVLVLTVAGIVIGSYLGSVTAYSNCKKI